MKLLEPLLVNSRAPLALPNPLAKLTGATALMLALFLSADPMTPAIALVGLALALPICGLDSKAFALRTAPLFLAAAGVGFFNGLVAADPIAGLAVALRLLAISLTGVLALATIDPSDLANSLVQHLRVSPRFAIGALAAFRLVPLFAHEWDRLSMARRARGIEADRSLIGRLAAFPGLLHALLVGAIRRGTALALAMDARGFGSRPCRTLSNPRDLTVHDALLVAGALGLAITAVGTSVALGTWRPLLGG